MLTCAYVLVGPNDFSAITSAAGTSARAHEKTSQWKGWESCMGIMSV